MAILCLVLAPSIARAQPGTAEAIARCDLEAVREWLGVPSGWEVACRNGIQVAVRVAWDRESERTQGSLLYREADGWRTADLAALIPEGEEELLEDLHDVRFLDPIDGHLRLSVVTGVGEDSSTRIEHQFWFDIQASSLWTLVFAGRANGSWRDSGADCIEAWVTDIRAQHGRVNRRWTFATYFDGDDEADRRRCARRPRQRRPGVSVGLVHLPLPPGIAVDWTVGAPPSPP